MTFYIKEAVENNWSVRRLEREIDKYSSLVETFIEVKDEIVEPDFSKEIAKEEIPQGLKIAKAK